MSMIKHIIFYMIKYNFIFDQMYYIYLIYINMYL